MMTSRAPVGAGDNGDNDDIDVNDNYGAVQTGLFEQQAGRLVYKCTDVLVYWCSDALVLWCTHTQPVPKLFSLLLFLFFLPVHRL